MLVITVAVLLTNTIRPMEVYIDVPFKLRKTTNQFKESGASIYYGSGKDMSMTSFLFDFDRSKKTLKQQASEFAAGRIAAKGMKVVGSTYRSIGKEAEGGDLLVRVTRDKIKKIIFVAIRKKEPSKVVVLVESSFSSSEATRIAERLDGFSKSLKIRKVAISLKKK
jgi:CobQ-like glutamine amidotransferase family enzyme